MPSFFSKKISSRSGSSRREKTANEPVEEETLGMLNFTLNVLPRILARRESAKEYTLKKRTCNAQIGTSAW
jgi:hypothetical protein